jgi:hypothetical protein
MTRLQYTLSTLQVVHYCTRMQDSITAGDYPLPWESRTPWTPMKSFSLLHDLLLSQAYPGAMGGEFENSSA